MFEDIFLITTFILSPLAFEPEISSHQLVDPGLGIHLEDDYIDS